MALECPFCTKPNADHAMVCSSCARDIVVPVSLLAERDDLIRKLNTVKDELARAKADLEAFKTKGRRAIEAAR